MLHIDVPALDPGRLASALRPERMAQLERAFKGARQQRTVHHINSTPAGGGVAEMLPSDVGYAKGFGADWRWHVIEAEPEYFQLTKRIHNALHGTAGPRFTNVDRDYIQAVAYDNLANDDLGIEPGDQVVLHDPQVVGLAPMLKAKGAVVHWRAHIGADRPNQYSSAAWGMLSPFLLDCDVLLFSRPAHVPDWVRQGGSMSYGIVPPSIDPASEKNKLRDPLGRELVLSGYGARRIVQVARWDRLKGLSELISAFTVATLGLRDVHLYLVGPEVEGVTDDPESQEVYREVQAQVADLAPATANRVHLVTLPMADKAQNARMTAEYQSMATIVAQASQQEGFGLTVTEAMWKGKLVVANAVGGIQDQITPFSGLLVDPPTIGELASKLRYALDMPIEHQRQFGVGARERVREHYLTNTALLNYQALFTH